MVPILEGCGNKNVFDIKQLAPFFFFLKERERGLGMGKEGAEEREREKLQQAPRPAPSLTRGSISELWDMTWAEIKSCTLTWLSHQVLQTVSSFKAKAVQLVTSCIEVALET